MNSGFKLIVVLNVEDENLSFYKEELIPSDIEEDKVEVIYDNLMTKYESTVNNCFDIDITSEDKGYDIIHKLLKVLPSKEKVIPISRENALYLLKNPNIFSENAVIMNKEYGEDDDWVEVLPEDLETLIEDESYKTFELILK